MQEKKENITKTIHRLQEYITKKGISFNKLAVELGLSNSYFSKMIKNEGSIGSDVMEKILRIHTDIDANWLLTGRGSMLQGDGKVNSILLPDLGKTKSTDIGEYDAPPIPLSLSESGKTTSIKSEKEEACPTPFFVPDSDKTKSINIVEVPILVKDDSEMVSIPVVDISVAAGSGHYNTDYLSEVDSIRFPHYMVKGGQPHICVRIKGESMVPTLQDGGYLVIRLLDRSEWQCLREGHVYVVACIEGRAFVKRLKNRFKEHGFIVCMSDNPDPMGYPNFNLMADEINTIWHAEWYISAKMPNIHETYYKKVGELEDSIEELKSSLSNEVRQLRQEITAIGRL